MRKIPQIIGQGNFNEAMTESTHFVKNTYANNPRLVKLARTTLAMFGIIKRRKGYEIAVDCMVTKLGEYDES